MIARVRRIVPGSFVRNAALVALAGTLLVSAATAAPVLGFLEDWPGTSLQGWSGGVDLLNPGTLGVGGADDGYLVVSAPIPYHLGTVSTAPEYAGDWMATKINIVKVWLNDVNAADPLEIHFSIGNAFNFWQYNVGFVPPNNAWQEFVVDLSSSANWTRIIGQGTFEAALQNVDRIHLRHDRAPFGQTPNYIQGDFGVDRLTLDVAVPLSAGDSGAAAGSPVMARAIAGAFTRASTKRASSE